ncbi:MAG: acyl-CoA dehydrogenase family protein [Deltaproteobacteria bacterium]|nr:acyl-CoA dehydrogenase family protein [Deltaproteobacteria bacterium]
MSRFISPFPDFAEIDSLFTPEQKQIQSAVRQFIQKEIEPLIITAYRTEDFPVSILPKMGAMGMMGSFLTGYGLPGLDIVSYGLVMKELERCDSGVRSAASVQGALVMFPLHEFGSEEQKSHWLPRLAKGESIGCFALSESEGGSDPSAMKTSVEDKGDHYLLTGSKMWITNGNISEIAVVWAKTVDGIRGFLVPLKLPGIKVVKMQNKLSLRASVTSELIFDQVRIPKSSLLPKTEGLKSALQCLNQARFGISWGVIGAAEACFVEALNFTKNRILFNKTLSSFQLVQRKLAIMATKITQSQLLIYRLSQIKEQKKLQPPQVSLAKQVCVEMALEVARTCRDILGANGIMDEYKTMRHLCNLETVSTYEGTNDIHLLILGQEITGTPAFF